jgi:hypothetical protein
LSNFLNILDKISNSFPRDGNFIPKFFANSHTLSSYPRIFRNNTNLTALLEIIIIICYYIYIRKERRKEMVNTLELRGIETYSPEIQTFLREIEKSFLQVLNNCVPADQQEKEAIQLRDTVEGIGNCLEMHCAPGEVFNCFSCGAFKEAYHASDSIVVKFCSTDNKTKKEQALLAAAEDSGTIRAYLFPSAPC